jgi:hypothetical protein
MKKTNIIYWVATGLFAAFMIFSSIGNVVSDEQSVAFINGHLGYPKYIIPFLGIGKILGVIGILLPGFSRLKEWAYAGLCFDLVGAVYSIISVDGFNPDMAVMVVPFVLLALSYIYHHKRLKESRETTAHTKIAVGV